MADANELIIKLKLDRSIAEAEAAAFHRAEKTRIAQTLTDAEVAEKAKTAFIQRENAQRIQAAATAQKTAIEQAKEAAEAARKLARETAAVEAREAKEAAKAKIVADRDAARAKAASARETASAIRQADKVMNDLVMAELKAVVAADRDAARARKENAAEIAAVVRQAEAKTRADKKQWDKRELTEEEAQQRAISGIIRKENRARVQAVVDSHKTEIDLVRDREASYTRFASMATSAVTSFAGQMIGLSSASAVFTEIEAGFQRVRDNVFRSTELLHEFQETLLELATLKDRMGDTAGESVDALKFQAATGQTRADAVGLQTGILGVAEAAVRGGKIDQAGVGQIGVGVGRLQAVMGGDAGAFGYLAGQIINQTPAGPDGKVDPQKVVQEFAAMQKLAQPGGPGFSSLARQYAKASGYVGNGLASPREAMGTISALSISEGEEAGTRFQQLLRATVGSLGRDRRVKVADGDDAIGTATYLKGLGATPGMNFIDIARRVTSDVDRAQAAATAKGAEFNPISYLQTRGYGNEESVNSLLTMGNLLRSGTFDQTFGSVINDPNAGSGVMAEAEARLATDTGLQARQTKAASDAAEMSVGAGRDQVMTNLRRAAWARLKTSPSFASMPKFEDVETSGLFSSNNWLYGYKSSVGDEATRMVIESARANNVPMKTYRASTGTGDIGSESLSYETATEDEVYRAAQALSSRGVNFGQQASEQAASAVAAKLSGAADKLDRAAEKFGQAVVPSGRPRQPAARP